MEVVWIGIGFLVGMLPWMPFIITERINAKLIASEGRIKVQIVEASRQRPAVLNG